MKKYYQILEINETATAEQIKKAYRKLALKWHPDKWMNKSLEERQKANEEMRKINEAFEILGDEEKKRRYDLGQNDFSTASNSESFEEYMRRMNEQDEIKMEEIDNQLRKLKLLAKFLLQRETWSIIWNEMLVNGVRASHLDNNLWSPCSSWGDKVYEIEIGDDENDEEGIDRRKVNEFKEKMIKAIREKKTQLVAEKMAKASSDLERTKLKSIEAIEKELQNRGLKIEDLEVEYHNYEAEINSLTKIWKIRSLEDRIIDAIGRKSRSGKFETKQGISSWEEKSEQPGHLEKEKKSPFSDNFDKKEPKDEKEFQSGKYDNWTKEELIKKIEDLEAEIKQLKSEKVETNELPEFKKLIDKKELELKEKQQQLIKISTPETLPKLKDKSPNSNNGFSGGWFVGGVIIVLIIGVLITTFYIRKKDK